MKTELEKGLIRIISEARYNSQWTNVVDMEIAKKSYELGCFESESTNAIKFVSWLCNTKNIHNILEMKNTELEMYELYKRSLNGMSEIPTDQFSIITYEGSEKYVGDKVFCVEFKPSIVNRISTITVNVDINNLYKRHIFFSTHDKALDYILSNQPCLSVNEILNAIGGSSEREKVDFDKLAEILKESTFCKLPIGI